MPRTLILWQTFNDVREPCGRHHMLSRGLLVMKNRCYSVSPNYNFTYIFSDSRLLLSNIMKNLRYREEFAVMNISYCGGEKQCTATNSSNHLSVMTLLYYFLNFLDVKAPTMHWKCQPDANYTLFTTIPTYRQIRLKCCHKNGTCLWPADCLHYFSSRQTLLTTAISSNIQFQLTPHSSQS